MKIGFVGTGFMGARFVRALLGEGHSVTVTDLKRAALDPLVAAGATAAGCPAEVARASEVIFGSVPGPAEVNAIFAGPEGLLSAMREGQTYFDLTTSDPATSRRHATQLREKSAHFFDAPVSLGGTNTADEATVTLMVGGDRERLKTHLDLLSSFCDDIFHFGDVGAGNAAKLVNNLIAIANRSIASEAVVLGVKAGLDPRQLLECLAKSSANSFVLGSLMTSAVARDFSGPFTIDLAAKDVHMATELARSLKVPLRITPAVQQLLVEGQARGQGGRASGSVLKIMEEAAGLERTPAT